MIDPLVKAGREAGFFLGCALVVALCTGHSAPSRPPRPDPVPSTTTTFQAVRTPYSGPGVECLVGGHRVVTDPQTARERFGCGRSPAGEGTP